MPSSSNKYTDPELREEVKEEVKQSSRGGKAGQWSARKAQMTASEYKKRGGDYKTDPSEKDEKQKSLARWTREDWQTKDGSGEARINDDEDGGGRKRYLPKAAWEKMSEREKEQTDRNKVEGSKEGKQFVGNTQVAKEKRREVTRAWEDEGGGEEDGVGEDGGVAGEDEEEKNEEEGGVEDEEEAYEVPRMRGDGQDQQEQPGTAKSVSQNNGNDAAMDEFLEIPDDSDIPDAAAAAGPSDEGEDEVFEDQCIIVEDDTEEISEGVEDEDEELETNIRSANVDFEDDEQDERLKSSLPGPEFEAMGEKRKRKTEGDMEEDKKKKRKKKRFRTQKT
ncbi:hypothetical protein MKZ38_008926 [Zalerion maritima]|uniref:Uncharacterized protein n=1 Tax=Zalerion maritima TaxID=339359 RepID=A0AAD5WNE0_9PEZI|nr:hypothetical protein MKZ38_008926 [Zalerion maritima]